MRGRVRVLSAVVFMVMALVTAVVTIASTVAVSDQAAQLLRERAAEVGLVLDSAVAEVPAAFQAQGAALRATGGSPAAFDQAVATSVSADRPTTYAWLRPLAGDRGFQVLAASGPALRAGQTVTGARLPTLVSADRGGHLVTTPVFGADRQLGFAIGAPTAPAGTVLYRENALGALSAPRESGTAPFAELDVVIYASAEPDPTQVVTSTTARLPLHGTVRSEPLPVGSSHWTVQVRARRPLIGSAAAAAPWLIGAVGAVGALLVASLVEIAGRRRDAALALYASEHQVAETLQRSLLPQLPVIAGVDLAARYIAAGQGQEVGGDWFDVFPLSGGRVGVAVGDVMGHDLAAAAAMSQVRAALRAYASDGDAPGHVLDRLDSLVTTFELTPLVTVFYGVLDAPEGDGSRLLRYANAGHLPPMLRAPSGEVLTVDDGASVLIGVPSTLSHGQAERLLAPGATLLLYTDGLVEVRGTSLETSLDGLAAALTGMPIGADAETACHLLLTAKTNTPRADDTAVLAIRIAPPATPAGQGAPVTDLEPAKER